MSDLPVSDLRVPASRASALRVFAVFALGYFMSYLFRGVNIGFAPFIARDLGVGARDLGVLTSLYFLGFAAAQIPAGVLLDRYGARRTNAVLLVVAAAGMALYAAAPNLAALMVGRLLIGVGVSVSFGGALKAIARTVAPQRLPFFYSLLLFYGGLGGVLVGAPLSALLLVASWRAACAGMAAFTLLTAALILLGTPEMPEPDRSATLGAQLRGTAAILRCPLFWRLVPFSVLTQAMFYATQSLWVGAFMLDVEGLGPARTATLVSLLGAALMAGSLAFGAAARALERRGVSVVASSGVGMALFVADQVLIVAGAPLPPALLWTAYGFFGGVGVLTYAVLTEAAPLAMAGRVNTTFTLLLMLLIFLIQAGIGAALGAWPAVAGHHPAGAHRVIWAALIALQLASLVPYLLPRREASTPAASGLGLAQPRGDG